MFVTYSTVQYIRLSFLEGWEEEWGQTVCFFQRCFFHSKEAFKHCRVNHMLNISKAKK